MNPTRTESIKIFLSKFSHQDLADLYNHNQEVQVNVAQDGGERVEEEFQGRRWNGWRGLDGTIWKSFRIPIKANTDPEYTDKPITFDLAAHVEGIGMTGWDWVDRVSRWVAYDFDAITGHSEKHGKKLSDEQLKEVQDAVRNVEWVTIRKSTSGKGLHLYVFLEPVATKNHNEHAALARAILGMLSAVCKFDFSNKVDAAGGNMWVWHRKMKGTDGLSLIKSGIPLAEIPPNWKEHIAVVSGRRRRSLPQNLPESQEDAFEELCGQRVKIKLDDEHQKLIEYFKSVNALWWWDQDHHMLVTHTKYLKDAHEALMMVGPFETNTDASDLNTQNCFAFPLRNGGWSVRRYTPGVGEAATWSQDRTGWTTCKLNCPPDLATAARTHEGIEHKHGGFVFAMAEQAMKAAELLGAGPKLPNWMLGRETKIKEHNDGKRIVVEIKRESSDLPDKMQGWLPEAKTWTRIFDTKINGALESEIGTYDDTIRHLVTETNVDYGWMISTNGQWRTEPLAHVKMVLQGPLGLSGKESTLVMGSSIFQCWTLVNKPFEPEYPQINGREWNRNAPQLRFHPTEDRENLSYPTWQRVLRHCGTALDSEIKNNSWARSNGILTGADYLKCWIASIFKEPLQPLPYLFFYSNEQNTGKSIFHEALRLLVTNGVVRADNALISPSGFNGELENSIICVVEETDLRANKQAYNRIKDWVTSIHLQIHKKQQTPYSIPNSSHWAQFSNSRDYCPIFPGDTRITMLYVEPLDPTELIPKKEMLIRLEKEAPDFLAAILSLEIPPSSDRLNIPIIETHDKLNAIEANLTDLQAFLKEECHYVTGKMIKFSEFYQRFLEWPGLSTDSERSWSRIKVSRQLPANFPMGRIHATGDHYIGNISWEAFKEGDKIQPKLILSHHGYLEEPQ